ncbi:HtaA domain-containing protein [Corynebacterium sp.]|uniref:HtaA domain-containing protein n=1 Tax=Corynebacterium sp. TaxID=1720 RepID=UPI003B3A0246
MGSSPFFRPAVGRFRVMTVAALVPLVGVTTVVAPTVAAQQPQDSAAGTSCGVGDPAGPTVVDARMGWGVRESFRSYITSSIANGGWTSGDGAVFNGGTFYFPGDGGIVSGAGGEPTEVAEATLSFGGSVTFTGHDGVLDLTVANPEVRISGDEGALVAEVTSNDTDGRPHDFGRIDVASLSLNLTGEDGEDGVLDGRADVTLTQEGSEAMGQFYEAGAEMDPLSFQAVLDDGCGTGVSALGPMPRDEGDGSSDGDGEVTVRANGGDSADGQDAQDAQDGENPVVAFLTTPATVVPTALVALVLVVGAWFGVRHRRRGR